MPKRGIVAVAIVVAVASLGAGIGLLGRDRSNSIDDLTTPIPGGQPGSGQFGIALSTGKPSARPEIGLTVLEGDPLAANAIDAVVRRLEPFSDDAQRQAFRFPTETLRRPRVGSTIDVPFGVAPRPRVAPPADGPLEVVRFQPEGDVAIAPALSVTFNQAMIELATLDQLDDLDVPVQVTPALAGRWRWIGTRTVRFEATGAVDRLPMATDYTVTIPEGTTSITGGTLAETVRFEFRTPPPQIVAFTPNGTHVDREPVLVAVFDQLVDPDAAIEYLTLTGDDREVDLRLATADEIAADEQARAIIETTQPGRFIALRPSAPLPTGTAFALEFRAGLPSAEGTRTTERATTQRFSTYGDFELERSSCGSGDGCRPEARFELTFTNPIDLDTFAQDLITITPEIPFAAGAYGAMISISAATEPDTTYTVTIDDTLRDGFGQALVDNEPIEFDVKRSRPTIQAFDRQIITLDPLAETPAVSVVSVGHAELQVEVYDVDVDDYASFQQYLTRYWDRADTTRPDAPWTTRSSSTIEIDGGGIERTETRVDLSADFDSAFGHLVVVVSPTVVFDRDDDDFWSNRPTIAWVQRTNIGVDAYSNGRELVTWATDVRNGSPIADVAVRLSGRGTPTATDAEGLASLEMSAQAARHLTARLGPDTAILAANQGHWASLPQSDSILGFSFSDRGLYRPGETAHVKGWFRDYRVATGRIERLTDDRSAIWTARDAFGNELAKGTVELSAASAFDIAIDIDAGAALGPASVDVVVNGGSGRVGATSASISIEEFRRPEFEVVTRADSEGPHVLTDPVTLAAVAQYFSGGTLRDAPTTWQVTTRNATYTPPNWSDFTFGEWQPWWIESSSFDHDSGVRFDSDLGYPRPDDSTTETYRGATDASGTHYLQLDFTGETPDLPQTVAANAAVEDVNRQQFASNIEVLVHSADLYVGLRGTRQFVRSGEALDVEAIVTDIDGNVVVDRAVEVRAARITSEWRDGENVETEHDAQECAITSADEPVSCSFTTDVGGEYRVTAVVRDDAGGRNRSELTRWVSGPREVTTRTVELETATVVPDREGYAPGDTAELLVLAPFAEGHGRLTLERPLGVETISFVINDGSAVIDVVLGDLDAPDLAMQVDIAGIAPRLADDGTEDPALPPRPAFASANLTLPVTPVGQRLDVEAAPVADTVEPGADTAVTVDVRDAAGNPVPAADVAVVVVDESVLALTGYELADPLSALMRPNSSAGVVDYLRATMVLDHPDVFAPAPPDGSFDDGAAEAADFDGSNEAGRTRSDGFSTTASQLYAAAPGLTRITDAAILERTNFDALAIFAPAVTTDANGNAIVEVALPDNLTRYRVMAIAASGDDQFGAGESSLTARLPLQVRPSAPRFANFGDRFEFPVVVQNQTDSDVVADVVLETSNLAIDDGSAPAAGRTITVPADDRVEIRFPVAVADAGTARYRVSVASGDLADSSRGEFPVYTPATTEAFATYGVVDDGAIAQPLLTPTGVIPQFGGLEIDTASTGVQALTDAVVYLHEYPYESADAYASRITALASLRDVFAAFTAEAVPDATAIDSRIRADIAALLRLQRSDGTFGYWSAVRDPQPYITVQAFEALALARAEGFDVDNGAYDRALGVVRTIESHLPAEWSADAKRAVRAYAINVRARAGDRDPAKAAALYREADLPLDAVAWIWSSIDDPAIDAEIERTIRNRANDTPAAVTFAAGYEDGAHLVLASDRRTDAIVLDALIARRPDSDMIPKVVAGLIGNQTRGRWNNIQENGFILVALHRYFATYEAVSPDFVARVWLGDTYAAEHEFAGRTTDVRHTIVPMDELAGDPDIVIAKDGPGRLYYRLGLRYAPDDLALDARDEGFVVERTYEGIEEGDVARDPDGTWRIRAGANVRVRLTMVAEAGHNNLALVDPLPAGLEAVNPDLATAPLVPVDPEEDERFPEVTSVDDFRTDAVFSSRVSYPWWQWYDHENLRDDRVEIFASYLGGGVYEYTYIARATTPGEFVVPPTKAEEIYAPEVFGRAASDRVIVE